MESAGFQTDLVPQVASLEDAPAFRLPFHVLDWEAFAGPGLTLKSDWRNWALAEPVDWRPAGTPMAPVSGMAPLHRRRADAADRLALEAAFRLAPTGGIPTVFASRHGQLTRSASLLQAQVNGEPASPMDFSLSVHNATAGQYAIASGDRHGSTSLSSRGEAFACAVLEAAGLIAEGAEKVMLVMSDPVLPAPYPRSEREEPAGYGLALLMGKEGGEAFSLALHPASGSGKDPLPQGLAFLRYLAGGRSPAVWQREGRRWTFDRMPASGPA